MCFKFKAPAANKAKCLRITVDATDTYVLEFIRIRGFDVTSESVDGLYAEDLRRVIESATALRLSL